MENGDIDYLSFVRGFTAALEAPNTAVPQEPPVPGLDAHSYAEGFTAGSQPVEHTLIYRELSIQDGGRFTGTLDLSGLDLEPAPSVPDGSWHEPVDQSRTEEAPAAADPLPVPQPQTAVGDEPPFGDRVQLSGTLELG
ncbi:hypothetical protein [Saccharomonospora cyanea]|uniref:Uncharacterized protein n=1 Tax=Saccharomonospora cyanea NA-134 TaxID=882082 RepID=H5XQB3_9PSEU|nr:hypothetical protein [Saccharomonospora cyanea]EHR63846.1 hypothetical protein SaccyDRAFT_5051 [Saccharomonospora cyanea NA-134]